MKLIFNYGNIVILWGIINLIGFLLMKIDKLKAKKGKWRISERTLIIFSIFGAHGILAAMVLFHHKLSKKKFYILVPILSLFQMFLILWCLREIIIKYLG
jgi:uncharacterized membrane protein YsdA (DUF1294 family)